MAILSRVFLGNPFDKLKFAWQAKLGKITIESFNGLMMLAFENLILCDDVARLAVNDVNFGDEAVYFVILNHIYNLNHKTRKRKKNLQLFSCTKRLRFRHEVGTQPVCIML